MPKMKTHRGAAKRFRVTSTGKVMRRKASGNHMLTKKSSSRRRRVSGMAEVGPEAKSVRRLIGE
ncbi:MAG TPA: 50S ribosomal protein L35 [Actinomycetota bacterium]|jgi:large subunit ribosomal protein L35